MHRSMGRPVRQNNKAEQASRPSPAWRPAASSRRQGCISLLIHAAHPRAKLRANLRLPPLPVPWPCPPVLFSRAGTEGSFPEAPPPPAAAAADGLYFPVISRTALLQGCGHSTPSPSTSNAPGVSDLRSNRLQIVAD